MHNFVSGVEKCYKPNPFHNIAHAASVVHATFMMTKTTRIDGYLRPLDKLALLTAAYCHDIDHPGTNNQYEVNSLSPLALLHGDSAVLERHHIAKTFQVLLRDGQGANNILAGLTPGRFADARKTIIDAILATDMSGHIKHCAETARIAKKASSGCSHRRGRGRGSGYLPRGWGAWRDREGERGVLWWGQRAQVSQDDGPRCAWGKGGGRGFTVSTNPPCPLPGYPTNIRAGGSLRELSPRRKNVARWRGDECGSESGGWEGRGRGTSGGRGGGGRGSGGVHSSADLFSKHKAEDRSFLTQTLMHCADLSGQVMEISVALEWGRRILEEFSNQAEMEATKGLPVTCAVSRDPEVVLKGQLFFLTRV
ncbi:unnamed protein product, partial [Discosporangium mesarthrocarpum]